MKENPKHEINNESPFGVNAKTRIRTLRALEAFARPAYSQELDIIYRENNGLFFLFRNSSATNTLPETDERGYVEGALCVHMAIRMHTEANAKKLPTISQDMTEIYLQDRKKQKETGKEQFLKLGHDVEIINLMGEEPQLGYLIKEVGKFNTARRDFFRGAYDMFFVLKAAAEAEKLENMYPNTEDPFR